MAKTEFEKLRDRFHKRGIDTRRPGFLDDPNFLAAEKEDPKFLFNYGRYVAWQPYDSAYLERAEQIIRVAAAGVRESLLAEDEQSSHGKCIHANMALSQILDLHGVWNFMVSGAVCITFPSGSGFEPFRFTLVGSDNKPGMEYGHKWLFAPPFNVVDITLNLQHYDKGFVKLLPDIVLLKELERAASEPRDLVCEQIIKGAKAEGFTASEVVKRLVPPHFLKFINDCGPGKAKVGEVVLKYIPAATGGSDGSLQDLASYSAGGETPYDFYVRKMKPSLDEIE